MILLAKIASKTVLFVRIAILVLYSETASGTACKTINAKQKSKNFDFFYLRITVFENHIEIRPNLDGIKTLLIEAGMKV